MLFCKHTLTSPSVVSFIQEESENDNNNFKFVLTGLEMSRGINVS